jgi:molybdopterin synthase catalytic subunit
MAPEPVPAPGAPRLAIVTADRLDEDAIRRAVENPRAGAVVAFSGVVRDHDGGREVLSLDYEAHPDAAAALAECCAAVSEETGLAVAAAHRIGHLEVGDVALSAAVAAPHRREAFAACELLVDRIKSSVPIWKRQHFADGVSEWVGL